MAFSSKSAFIKSVYFNETEYLQNKAAQLNVTKFEGRTNWTVASTKQAIQNAGISVWDHFNRYGAFEQAADGGCGIDPSKYFDLDKYYTEKIAQCARDEGTSYTKQSLMNTLKGAGLTPLEHFARYGYMEDLAPRQNMAAKNYYDSVSAVSSDSTIAALQWKGTIDWNKVGAQYKSNTMLYTYAQSLPQDLVPYKLKDFQKLNANQKAGITTALEYLHDLTGIDFVYTSDANAANMTFLSAYPTPGATPDVPGADPYPRGIAGITFNFPTTKSYVAVTPSISEPQFSGFNSWTKGSAAYPTLIHEIGHALGLDHPNGNPYSSNKIYSTMSYVEASADQWYYTTNSDDYYSPQDLMALNYLYGSDGLNGNQGLVYKGSFGAAAVTNKSSIRFASENDTLFAASHASENIQDLLNYALSQSGPEPAVQVGQDKNGSRSEANQNKGLIATKDAPEDMQDLVNYVLSLYGANAATQDGAGHSEPAAASEYAASEITIPAQAAETAEVFTWA